MALAEAMSSGGSAGPEGGGEGGGGLCGSGDHTAPCRFESMPIGGSRECPFVGTVIYKCL